MNRLKILFLNNYNFLNRRQVDAFLVTHNLKLTLHPSLRAQFRGTFPISLKVYLRL
jgi:hypothetical protein